VRLMDASAEVVRICALLRCACGCSQKQTHRAQQSAGSVMQHAHFCPCHVIVSNVPSNMSYETGRGLLPPHPRAH
jgi:hypothetical protein